MSATQNLNKAQVKVIASALTSQHSKLINDAKDYERISNDSRAGSDRAEKFAGLALERRFEASRVKEAHKAVTS